MDYAFKLPVHQSTLSNHVLLGSAPSMSGFKSFALSPTLQKVLDELGYDVPTPIQVASLPLLLDNKDVIGQAKTGSGKTLAYALPIVQQIDLSHREPHALILCPTRELSQQVVRVLRTIARRHPGLAVLPLTGGEAIRGQIESLQRGVHALVGTPGRIRDHLERSTLKLNSLQTVVLDEADRMLDMGFQGDVEKILDALPKKRQTLFFSATFTDQINEMSQRHQINALKVGNERETKETNSIDQYFIESTKTDKIENLKNALSMYCEESAMVFCNFKASVAKVTETLREAGANVGCLHGDLDQFHRDQVLARFRNQSIRILIATDVAGRGIDIEEVDAVINFELPDKPEIYIHRIGRTGRAGHRGIALSIIDPKEQRKLKAIKDITKVPITPMPQKPSVLKPETAITRDAPMRTILISGGRKDKIRPGDVLGALTGKAGGLEGTDIGKIEIHDRLTYVAVRKEVSQRAEKGLNTERIKRKRFRATLILF